MTMPRLKWVTTTNEGRHEYRAAADSGAKYLIAGRVLPGTRTQSYVVTIRGERIGDGLTTLEEAKALAQRDFELYKS